MKNAIMYYYNLVPFEIHQTGINYSFSIKEEMFFFLPTINSPQELKEIYEITVLMTQNGYPVHQIVINNQKQNYTDIQGKNYVLLKANAEMKENLCLGEILSFSNVMLNPLAYPNLHRQKWDLLWSSKIDYFEYQVSQFGKKYPIIRESFSYFCGLAENAVTYAHTLSDVENLVISHKRTGCHMCLWELYNPLNFIIDDRTRDASEYFKDKFFYGYLAFEEVEYYLEYCISVEEYPRFYARMLYPSYYFDIYEQIIKRTKKEAELLIIIHKIKEYENLLYNIFSFMNKKVYVPKPDWIENNIDFF